MFVGDNNFDIVSKSLAGAREVDEQTQASLAILSERLESLKRMSGLFDGVMFSSHVQQLSAQRVAVG
jgi:hypothetical protein